jgi:hypothetical protein
MKIKRPTREQENLKNAHISAKLMIIKVVSDIHHEHHENQVIEIKPVNHVGLRVGQQNIKDGKMKVYPTMLLKTKDWLTHCQCPIFGTNSNGNVTLCQTNSTLEPGVVIRFLDLKAPERFWAGPA